MYSRDILIKNPTGLHARPATQLVHLAESYKSAINIVKDNDVADVKSIFSLLAVGLAPGTKAVVRASGEDEEQAVNDICKFIDSLEE